ncbi:TPA: hypothetical protein DCL30_02140 [Candidatus Peribacteria bacterium]|nr:MAG: hypothetical protein A3J91_02670 [Candidatus Peribacteria bacterium RIFOXYC2_FULL_58_10]OGJ85230.1 MAG: hypothetical protein A2529_02075 [Candidatus Peribacteria bacterium RIFOXYD2_FULL_58_15]HAI98327.1 hypothetical protein [Candidatus Peribacteria bacterium]HAS33923.1 hypothetical protein [Candidatus Peribacteria bacterium]
MLELRHISKRFSDQRVLKDVHLTVGEGKLMSIMGKSGSGKTTLLSLMAGLVVPDEGEILFEGKEITRMPEEQWAAFRLHHVGFIFQDFRLIPSLSVFDNILLAIHPRRDIPSEEKKRRTSELLGHVGLGGKHKQSVESLSGGEKQRVAIARSLMNKPKLVLADEPTGNLDSHTAESIMDLFSQLHRDFQTTFVIVTHDKDVAEKTEDIYRLTEEGLSLLSSVHP